MKKTLCAILALIMLTLSLVACGESGELEIPEDMQLVRQSNEDGYIFFGPEGWTVSNQGNVAATFISSFNKTSISFVKADKPYSEDDFASLPEKDEEGKTIDYIKPALDAYMNETSKSFAYEITPATLSGSPINFGASGASADRAYEYVYSYTAEDKTVTCWQILVIRGDDFFIFTYTSFGKAEDETSTYRIYLPKAQLTVQNFKFTAKSQGSVTPSPEYPKDADGYVLVSNKSICGFDLYLPADYTVIDNSALVSAKITDNANINIFKATDTGIAALDYMLRRRESAMAIADEGTFKDLELLIAERVDLEGEYFKADEETGRKAWEERCSIWPEYSDKLVFGNAVSTQVVAYKYSYSHGGNDYVCYMIFGVSPGVLFKDGYVFTYTSANGEYDTHWNEIEKILEKVEF